MAAVISATDSEVTKPINGVLEQTFLRSAMPHCPYLAGTVAGKVSENAGSNVAVWQRIGSITPSTSALSEQTGNAQYFGGRDAVAVSKTNVTAALSKFGQIVVLSEEGVSYNSSTMVPEIYKQLGICSGRSLNMVQRDVVDDNATVVYAGGVASTGALVSKITRNSIDYVVNILTNNVAMPFTAMSEGGNRIGSTPILPAFWGVCHPNVAQDIKDLSGFKSVETYAGYTQTAVGEFGILQSAGYAVRFVYAVDATVDVNAGGSVTGTGLRSTGASNIDVYTTAIYGQDALGSVGLGKMHPDGTYTVKGVDSIPNSIQIIMKGKGSGGTSDPLDEIQTVAYKFWHGGAVLNSNWARVIKSGATALTS